MQISFGKHERYFVEKVLRLTHNLIVAISCEKCCLNHHHRLIHFLHKKVIFPTTAVTLYEIKSLRSPNVQPTNGCLTPPTSWLVKCLIHRVRNLKCIILNVYFSTN